MLRMPAIATPTRCTSFGPRWRSTCAASVSPSDSSRIAALSTLVSLVAVRLSLIGVDPLFDDLGYAARIFRHQTLDSAQLRIIPLTGARQQYALRPAEADAVFGQLAIQTGHLAKLHVAGFSQFLALAAAGDVVEHRTQHTEHQHQDEQHAKHLFDDVPEPGLGVERNIGNFLAQRGGEGGVDHTDAVPTAGIEA